MRHLKCYQLAVEFYHDRTRFFEIAMGFQKLEALDTCLTPLTVPPLATFRLASPATCHPCDKWTFA